MAKVTRVTLTNLDNPSTAVSQINANFAAIQTAMDNTLSRDGTSPNPMVASLDMNSNRIINLPAPENDAEPARKVDMDETLDLANSVLEGAQEAETNAEAHAAAALLAKTGAETAETNAELAEVGAEAALAAAEALVAAFPTVSSTDASASPAPSLVLDRNSATPAVSDRLGQIVFRGRDSTGAEVNYGSIEGLITDATNGSEDGGVIIRAAQAGVEDVNHFQVNSTEVLVNKSDDTAASGPVLVLDRISTSPAASDTLGKLVWRGRDSVAAATDYADIFVTLVDPTNTSEDSRMSFRTMRGGTFSTALQLENNTNNFLWSDDGATAGPLLVLDRTSTSPAASDVIGSVNYYGRDSGGTQTEYARIDTQIVSPTDGAEYGTIRFITMSNGASVVSGSAIDVGFATRSAIRFPAAQVASSGANDLDDYEEGTWTPALLFGSASVGMTGTFTGRYTKIGRQVHATFSIVLTAKGSSTGTATIGGLPFTILNADPRPVGTVARALNTSTLGSSPGVLGQLNTSVANLYHVTGGTSANITDANFGNTTELYGSIIFEASA
jgi:hypothetical protein